MPIEQNISPAQISSGPLAAEFSFIPISTYRLQFNKDFTFSQAHHLVPYLKKLGINACYASPLSKARSGSMHGYDVVNHGILNPEIGTEEQFTDFSDALRKNGIGLILDVVPNHMCIGGGDNAWWNDVLENGPCSPHARFFDILWNPPKPELVNKVLLPFLGDQFGQLLEDKQIQVCFEEGAFFVRVYSFRLPIGPKTWPTMLQLVLEHLSRNLGEENFAVKELASVISALNHLPPHTETNSDSIKERRRETEVVRHRLNDFSKQSEFTEAIQSVLADLNGTKGNPKSFDRLEELLKQQMYRLCFWQAAADEINYRRFFDVSELAAVKVEEPEVFDAVHKLAFQLVKKGEVQGLRIDHVDGLYDPKKYLDEVQKKLKEQSGLAVSAPFYVVVEKILGSDERISSDWSVQGTTGYEFMTQLNGIFVQKDNEAIFRKLYGRLIEKRQEFSEVLAECKRTIMLVSLASELRVLAIQLDRISEQHRRSRDFTLENLRFALREIVAYFVTTRVPMERFEGGKDGR